MELSGLSINEEDHLNLGPSISAETNRRDEGADMMKNMETDPKKRKGTVESEEQQMKLENDKESLYELPESVRASSANKTQEMLSIQMLSGIPEADLGTDANIKNTTSTEEAKAKVLAEDENKKKDSETSFVPTNMAVNYVQPNRWSPPNRKRPANERAGDDYYYKKFKKMKALEIRRPPLPLEGSPANRKRTLSEKTEDDYDKLKKISEEAKAKVLAEEQNRKKDSKTSFAITNTAVNYVQPNRWSPPNRKRPANERAGDDYYYKKFKKMKALEIRRPPLPLERSAANRKRPLSEKTEDDYDKLKKICRQY
ncbi:splicing factor C9orf78-like [Gavia stellata]|uniref:splicing factor C9orf78-like n=1 Tax=Gavia stellata TaxID=37040 RepID=UPI0028A07C7B|nr:splicing factor C9orf78-like [Gavia stellata]